MHHRHFAYLRLLIFVACIPALASCGGQKNPFNMAQVSGKIIYTDGKPIDAAVVTVFFVPQNVAAVEKMHARPAQAKLEKDGSFNSVTTAARNDGAIVGKHKIVLMAWNADQTPCAKAFAKKYGAAATTPLEVEVTPNGPNRFDLTVERGP